MKYKYKDVVMSLPKKKNSNSSLWVQLVTRKLSFPFTYLFINMGFSANGVSILSIFFAIASAVCFMIPSKSCVIAAFILANFWLLLDCVDGNVARVKKQKTYFGEFVDDIGGYYIEAFIYVSMSVCVYNFGGIFVSPKNYLIIILGASSSIFNILSRLIYKNYCHFADYADTSAQEQHTVDDKRSLYYIRNRISKEFGISGLFMPAIIVCGFLNSYDILVLFYLLFNAFALLSTTVIYIYKAEKYDRTHTKE